MKKILFIVLDGLGDLPIKELNNKTPLEAARTTNMDAIANKGIIGLVKTIPDGLIPGSDVANMSILGYDPVRSFSQSARGPLEAVNLGIELEEGDLAFRCNLVTVSDGKMVDYSAGHISSNEAALLIKKIDKNLSSDSIRFYPGVSYRHIMVVKKSAGLDISDLQCWPPHDIMGKPFDKYLPEGKDAEFLKGLMHDSVAVLEHDEINQVRIDLKENPANMIWLWGGGKKLDLISFKQKYGVDGSVISAVDLVKGIGRSIGFQVINVPGATAYYDTNYQGKAEAAIKQLKNKDFVFVHVEAADEAGHNGDLREKITAIERFDQIIVGALLDYFKRSKNFRVMLLPDHATPISLRTHTSDLVPVCMMGKNIVHSGTRKFCESEAKKSDRIFNSGVQLMEYFIRH